MMIFLPDGDAFVVESSNEVVLGEPVWVFFGLFLRKDVWKVFTKLFPFSKWTHFYYQDKSILTLAKANFRVYITNM